MSRKYVGSNGRGKMMVAAGATSVGLFLFNYIPNTFGLEYYKKFLQSYSKGEPLPLSSRVLDRFKRATELCGMEDYEHKLLRPFAVVGFNVATAGSTLSRFGAIIGIPTNYEYERSTDIRRNEIRFQAREINWNSESGKYLEESLVLSEDEQLFELCKSLLSLKTHYVLRNSLFPSLNFLMVYIVGHYLNASLGLLMKPFGVRLVMYVILALFGSGSFCFMKDFSQVSSDAEIDKHLSAMGRQFVEAGIRYYDKQLKRNMALRDLLSDNTYTAKGNINYLIRQKSLPLTVRKSFFESKMEHVAN